MSALAARKSRRACQALLDRRLHPVSKFERERIFERKIPLCMSRATIGAHACLGECADLLGERFGARAGFSAWNDTIDQPELKRLHRTDRATGEDQIERARNADQTRQANRSTIDQRHAKTTAEDAECSV